MKRLAVIFASFVSALPALVFAETIVVDVGAWAEVGTGETNGWTVSGIDRYSDGLTRLDTKDDFAFSPEFADNVTQVVLRVRSSGATMTRFLTLIPAGVSSGARQQVAAASSSLTNETFSWTQGEAVRQFRLQNETGSGNAGWGIASLAVYTDRIEPPTGLREEVLYRDVFVAGWDAVPEAVRYEIRFASVTRVPPRFKTVAAWDFSSLTNTYGSTRTLDQLKDANPGLLDDLSGENVCMQKYESGHLQIGMGEELGRLVLQLPKVSWNAEPLTGSLCAWKYPAKGKPTMPLYLVADGVTNDLATVELTNERAEYRFPILAGIGAESVILSSATNGIALTDQNGRVRVERFAILSDYVPGSVATNDFSSIGAKTTRRMLKDLVPGEWVWSVRSFDANGRDSPWSPFRAAVLDPARPRRPVPGFSVSFH